MRRTWTCQSESRRGQKDDLSAEAPVLQRQAEMVEVVQTGEEKAPVRSYSTFQDLKGPIGKMERNIL